jgi:hypothetical protein
VTCYFVRTTVRALAPLPTVTIRTSLETAEEYWKFAERCEAFARTRPELAKQLLETAYLWREVAAAAEQIEKVMEGARNPCC